MHFLGKRLGILGIWGHPFPPLVDLVHLFGFMTQSSISTPSGSKSRFLSKLTVFCAICQQLPFKNSHSYKKIYNTENMSSILRNSFGMNEFFVQFYGEKLINRFIPFITICCPSPLHAVTSCEQCINCCSFPSFSF